MRRLSFALVLLALAGCSGKRSPTTPTAPAPASTRIIRRQAILEFGGIPLGSSDTRDLRIYNDGNSVLAVTGMTGPAGHTASWTSVGRPLSRVEQRQFEKLMAAARPIFADTEGEDR
jgi:hypothetical protein